MADFANDYTQIDDLDSTANLTATSPAGQNIVLATTNTGNFIEGGNAVEWKTTATGVNTIEIDNSSGGANKPFKITEDDFLIWFYYVKGKGSNILFDQEDAFTIRLYFGAAANNDYVDYPQGGDSTLPFGWKTYICSGKSGTPGGTHNNGSDWDLDITQIDLRLNVENANDVGTGTDTPLIFDECRYGRSITLTSGLPTNPADITDLVAYDADDGSLTGGEERPLGVVDSSDTFINLRTSLEVGNGSTGTGNEGHFAASGSFVLFNQGSEEVKYNLHIKNGSSAVFGNLTEGVDGDYPDDGCQVVQPSGSYANIKVDGGGTLKVYDGKLYRWRDIILGNTAASGSTTTVVEFNRVDIDSCERVIINEAVTFTDVEIHDNSAIVSAQCGEIYADSTFSNVKIYNCVEGFHFKDDVSVRDYLATDNQDYDISILDGKEASIINSRIDRNKIQRIIE